MAGEDHTDDNELLIALRHPLRRQILRAMAEQDPISPRQISDELRQPLSNVSYHVRVLADCGAVTLVDTAPVRGSMQHFYSPAIEEPWALAVLGLSEDGEPVPGGDPTIPHKTVISDAEPGVDAQKRACISSKSSRICDRNFKAR